MNNWAVRSVVGFLAVGLLVAGCGGGDDDATITKEAFVSQANGICLTAQKKQLADLTAGKGDPTSSAVVLLRTEADKIKALGAPSGADGEIKEMLAAVQKAIALAVAGTDLVKANASLAKAEEIADEQGLTKCLAS